MRVRVFTGGRFSQSKGSVELPALPRAGETLLSREPKGPVYYAVEKVLHVEGADPIAFVLLTEGEGFEGLDLGEAGLASRGALEPLAAHSPFDDMQPPLGLD